MPIRFCVFAGGIEAGEEFRLGVEVVGPCEISAGTRGLGVHELEDSREFPGAEDGVGIESMAEGEEIDQGEEAGASGGDFPGSALSTVAAKVASSRAMSSGLRRSISASWVRAKVRTMAWRSGRTI